MDGFRPCVKYNIKFVFLSPNRPMKVNFGFQFFISIKLKNYLEQFLFINISKYNKNIKYNHYWLYGCR